MRNIIDVNVAENVIELISNIYDGEACESCINFIVDHAVNVTLTADGVERVQTVESVAGVACYVLDDALLRSVGEFTVTTDGVDPLRFIVEKDIPANVNISIRTKDGALCVRCAETNEGAQGGGAVFINFDVDLSTGQLIMKTAENYGAISFRINNGFLEVVF